MAVRLKAPQRRARILEAAEQAFAARGYHSTSMDDIAAAAGISKPVLYDHFSSKLDLYTRLTESIRDELTARGAAAMASDAPPSKRIRTGVEAFFAFVEERPSAARVLLFTPVAKAPGTISSRGTVASFVIVGRVHEKRSSFTSAGPKTRV